MLCNAFFKDVCVKVQLLITFLIAKDRQNLKTIKNKNRQNQFKERKTIEKFMDKRNKTSVKDTKYGDEI